jgi:hypothetical protein
VSVLVVVGTPLEVVVLVVVVVEVELVDVVEVELTVHTAALTSGFEQKPVSGSQVPARWQASIAVQTTGFDPTHDPAWHESDCVHAFPSSHPLPFAFAGVEQTPVWGSQLPGS